MSEFYPYICTRSTYDPVFPPMTADVRLLARNVADGFAALAGGHFVVGQMAFYPIQRSVPNHLLCDGREIAKADFPELYDYLGDTQGTPVDPDNFVLPNYIGSTAFTPAAAAAPETTTGGTTSTSDGGDVDSGGRHSRLNFVA